MLETRLGDVKDRLGARIGEGHPRFVLRQRQQCDAQEGQDDEDDDRHHQS